MAKRKKKIDVLKKNCNWLIADEKTGEEFGVNRTLMPVAQVHYLQLATLMDIRRELRRLNRLLHCRNFTNIPHRIQLIADIADQTERRNHP